MRFQINNRLGDFGRRATEGLKDQIIFRFSSTSISLLLLAWRKTRLVGSFLHEARQTNNDSLSDAQCSSATSQVEVLCVSVRPHQQLRSCRKRRKQTHQKCIVTEHHRYPLVATQTLAPKSRLCIQFISTLLPVTRDGRAHCARSYSGRTFGGRQNSHRRISNWACTSRSHIARYLFQDGGGGVGIGSHSTFAERFAQR